ncbi:MAG: CHAT domain-containing protein, partial [Pyrinomonadaceae bacterium]|nr:CHAT domain-containing protein [Pyrinomonadaceae bacterium]
HGSGRALVEFTLSGDEIGAFVLADGEVEFFAGIASNGEIAGVIRSLRFQFESLKYGQNVEAFAASLRKKADVLLARLYEKLVRPIRDAIGDRGLVIVPAGAIHLVPFHALKDEGHYLIERREVVYAPSAAVWERLPNGDGNSLDNALLIAFADEKIPLVESEVREIGKLLSRAETLSGNDATFEGYLERSGSADLIHFACHGSFRPDDPMNSSLHLADGWVTVNDICRQRLRARLVTLSACESGVNDVAAGEEILGLSRGFLTAGAASVLMTLWTVNDRATAKLMTEFYGQYTNGGSAAAALQQAQRQMIRRGEHPYFWAPFVLVSG